MINGPNVSCRHNGLIQRLHPVVTLWLYGIYANNKSITLEIEHSDSTPDKVFIVIIRTIPQYARWNIIQTQTDALQWFLFRQLKGITAPIAELKVCQHAEL